MGSKSNNNNNFIKKKLCLIKTVKVLNNLYNVTHTFVLIQFKQNVA